jgi:hypothetical protein
MESTQAQKHRGSCHCGDVRFSVEVDATKGGRCNCSVCTKVGVTSALVKPAAFQLLSDPSRFSSYEWGAKISERYFCKRCGVHAFGRGHLAEVGGDYVSVNLNCLDDIDVSDVAISYWDGRHDNWEGGPRPTPWPVAVSAE